MKRIIGLAAALALGACATQPTSDLPFGGIELPNSGARMPEADAVLTRIHLGSCLKQEDPLPIIDAMLRRRADLTILLGDNVYGDVSDTDDPLMPELVEAYRTLGAREEFQSLISASPVMATWDDHDYGQNDAGGDFPLKDYSEVIFETFWNVAEDDPRSARQGVYTSETFGPQGQRVQVILLDTRFFRTALQPTDDRRAPGKERYIPSIDPEASMLGARQEAWLYKALREPADVRILVSSVQVLADGHGWEAWRTLPAAQERLFDIIESSGARNTILVSGDRHLGGIYAGEKQGVQLTELTASSLNAPASIWRERDGVTTDEPGPFRLGRPVYDENFGEIEIDWDRGAATISLRNVDGKTLRAQRVRFDNPSVTRSQPGQRVQDL